MKTRALMRPALAALAMGVLTYPATAQAEAPRLTVTEVVVGLDLPWDVAFLPDGTMFYTEKCRGLSVRTAAGDVRHLYGMAGTEGYAAQGADLFCEGQAGMNGVAVDPGFAENRRVYVYSASNLTAPGSNRVIRLTLTEGLDGVADRTDIVTDIRYKPASSDHPFGGPGAHNGGRLRFNPVDGFLYVTTGDTHFGEAPQSPTILGGNILRIDTDGNAAPGNGVPDGFDPRMYTYGHRNVQGIAFRPGTGEAVVAEHGPWHSDELTVLRPGGNGGWDPRPNMAGRGDCPDSYCGYSPNQMEGMDPVARAAFMPMTDLATYPDAMRPAWTNNGLSQGMASAAFLVGDQWGDWNGRLAIGFMGIGFGGTPLGQRIDVVDLAADGLSLHSIQTMDLGHSDTRYRGLELGPDGALYAVTDGGTIYRIAPQ
jgi:glucose/arabinose dehydrogenase